MKKQIGIFPEVGSGYRSQAFSGFISPACVRQQHFHFALEPTKYVPMLHSESMEARFGMPKPSHFGVTLKPVKFIKHQPPAEPAPSTSFAANRHSEAKFAGGLKSPSQQSSFKSPMPSGKLDLSSRPRSNRGRAVAGRFASSTPRKRLFPAQNDSISSLGAHELSFGEVISLADSGIHEDAPWPFNWELESSRQSARQVLLEQRIEKLERDVISMKQSIKLLSSLVSELAAAVRIFIQNF